MSVYFRALLLVVTLGLGSMNCAWAVSYYDFTFDGTVERISGTFTVNDSNLITGITGSMSTQPDKPGYTGPITSLIDPGGYLGNDNLLIYPASPNYLNGSGVSFSTSGVSWNLSTTGGGFGTPYALVTGSGTDYGTMSVTSSGGAPEIDGSLAPKVGFLLGCLALLFGRKKTNSDVDARTPA